MARSHISVTRKLNKILPNFWKKVAKKSKNPQFDKLKHLHQTTFETLKYQQQTAKFGKVKVA
jgi:hypothetical protein